MPTRVVTAARQADGWYLTTHTAALGTVTIGTAPRIVDADKMCAEFFPPGTDVDIRIQVPRDRRPRTAAPAPKWKSRRGGSGKARLR